MEFSIDPQVFEVLPAVCIGVVVARGIDNTERESSVASEIKALLDDACRGQGCFRHN